MLPHDLFLTSAQIHPHRTGHYIPTMDTFTKLFIGGLAIYGLHRLFEAKDPRHTFFSFHYEADIWRVNAVRNSWVTYGDPRNAGFFDKSLWETARTRGDAAIERLIDHALEDSEVTVVLIGEHTCKSRWVRYEIEQSLARNNGIIGVYIDRLRDAHGRACPVGQSPFEAIEVYQGGPSLTRHIPHYDWITDNGYSNLRTWLLDAPRLSDIADALGIELCEGEEEEDEDDEDDDDDDDDDEDDDDDDDDDE